MSESKLESAVPAPTRLPHDLDEERRRLRADAEVRGIDPDEAEQAARRVAGAQPLVDAYRAVDRRLATGYDLADAEGLAAGVIEDPHAVRTGRK